MEHNINNPRPIDFDALLAEGYDKMALESDRIIKEFTFIDDQALQFILA